MGWPNIFANATSPELMLALDQNFNQAAAMLSIPCSASGTNLISLTPLVNCPTLTAYNELGGYRFVAAGSSSGPVTAQYNGLSILNVYHGDGVTQAGTGDIISGGQYILTYHAALNGGAGGFYLESPSVANASAAAGQTTPGGRLTLQSGVPVMFTNQTAKQIIYYAPQVHPFVPIYNGSTVQMYQFTSSLSDQVGLQLNMGGAANFPLGVMFDLFVTLIGGVPTLVALAWTNLTTRATTLSIFGGFLTNSGAITVQTGPNTSTGVLVNQATWLGSFFTSAQGQTGWLFGGSASGGSQSSFYLYNYYNQVNFTSNITDNGASYTYTTATVRAARASNGNSHLFVQGSSEKPITVTNSTVSRSAGATGAIMTTGIGLTSSSLSAFQSGVTWSTATNDLYSFSQLAFSVTGFQQVWAVEEGDGVNANNFDEHATNTLGASFWA